ncbi:McrC family protein [Halopiger aswanensis]|uniref:5-methylcytosine-specific restriction enzyme subunit McrC n=1 Tax=Halopiger aswanensis TaxID=148449 RepID=A0A3R7GF00_9EURY|nr:hypothetical protein [Halopiger aswanensis]RKD87659.1 5-methylcytosine-specific restriction enzyme subunit McrC [Halopiger aswanensis]
MSSSRRLSITERDDQAVDLPEKDLHHLASFEEITVSYAGDGQPRVSVSNHVGVIGLPSGNILEIRPKASCNLLHYLAYVGDINDELVRGTDAAVSMGDSFVDLVARLYLDELDTILKRGLNREYLVQESSEKHLRGQLDLQRQLQRQGVAPKKFECRYDELSTETVLNKILLDGLHRLRPLVTTSAIRSDVNRFYSRLQQYVSHERMSVRDIESVSLTRLDEYYADALELAKLIFKQIFVADLGGHDRRVQSLLIDMETIFERLVYRAVRNIVSKESYEVKDGSIGHLVQTESDRGLLQMYPDFWVVNKSNDIVFVGDAKWKTGTDPSRNDLYQIAAYQAKYGTPGMLVYPDLDSEMKDTYTYETPDGTTAGRGELQATELQTGDIDAYSTFKETVEATLRKQLPGELTSTTAAI